MNTLPDTLLPIREVSRVTGVNAVTLRAWERRYGLVTPHRTLKGHRLYTEENVRQIQDILTWLGRGVAVGQVKELLHAPLSLKNTADDIEHDLQQRFADALLAFDTQAVEALFNQAINTLSIEHVICHLLEPVLLHLQQRWQGQFGSQLEQVYCHTWLHNRLATQLHARNQQVPGQPVLLVNLSDQHCEPSLWLLALQLNADNIRFSMLEWEVPASELALIAERCSVRAVVLYSSHALPNAQLLRQLPKLVQHQPVPVMFAGPAATIHQQRLLDIGIIPLPEVASLAYPLLLAQLRTLQ